METPIFDISLYNDEFFKWHDTYARQYSLDFMDWYVEHFGPKSVIDFGCGNGPFLEAAYKKKIKKLKGYEIGGDFARKYTPKHIQDYIQYSDCTVPLKTGKFDCVISIEVAEHIEPLNTNTFVKNIVNALSNSGKILFTAAPPGQDGCGHINCKPKDFWLEIFGKNGVVFDNENYKKIIDKMKELNVPSYIINNFMIFGK